MQDIDFLPAHYRQKRVQRQSQPWRIVVVAVVAGLLAAAVFNQQRRSRRTETELATIMPQHDLAVGRNRKLAGLHDKLKPARNDAELFTYLRHPWPRTQLLAAVLAPLPKGISLDQIHVTADTSENRPRPERRFRAQSEPQDDQLDKLPPAARDLIRLRDEFDQIRTVVLISGTTGESAAVHRYLGELGGSDLFAKAELDSLDSPEGGRAGTLQFRATLTVRPGYGQPDGPTDPGENVVARTDNPGR